MRWRLLAVGLALIVLGGCSVQPRAEGSLERWLQAVGDQGRDGLRDDAGERAAGYADAALAAEIVPANPEEDERHFSDLEVGRAKQVGAGAEVPFRVTQRLAGGDTEEVSGVAVMQRSGDRWRITAIRPRYGEKVPSEGGAEPGGAETRHWLAAIAAGLLLLVGSVLLVETAPSGRPGEGLASVRAESGSP